MKKLSEGATAVTAVFLLMTAVVSFFFSVQRHQLKRDHRHTLEEKQTQYDQDLKKAQDQMREDQRRAQEEEGFIPFDPYPSLNVTQPDYYLDDIPFREQDFH